MAGIPIKKLIRAAASRLKPSRSPALIVAPERLIPGMSASACARPMTTPSSAAMPVSGRCSDCARSATQSSAAPASTATATTSGVRTLVSRKSPAKSPKMTAGIVPTRMAMMSRSSAESPRRRPSERIGTNTQLSRRVTSLRSATRTAASVPRCSTAPKAREARSGSLMEKRYGIA